MKKKKEKKSFEKEISRLLVVTFLVFALAVVLILAARSLTFDIIRFSSSLPIVAAISAAAAIVLFIIGRKSDGEKVFSLKFISGIIFSSAVLEAVFVILENRGYGTDALFLIFFLAMIIAVVYGVKLTSENHKFAAALYEAFALIGMYIVRDVQGKSLKFYVFVAVFALLLIANYAVFVLSRKDGKLFGQKIFAKKFPILVLSSTLVSALASLAVFVFVPAAFSWLILIIAVQYLVFGYIEK